MSKSAKIKVKKPRFTDPVDVRYLSSLGTTLHSIRMESARVKHELIDFVDFGQPEFGFGSAEQSVVPVIHRPSGDVHMPANTEVLNRFKRVAHGMGYRTEVKALLESSGITIDLFLKTSKPEKVYVDSERRAQ